MGNMFTLKKMKNKKGVVKMRDLKKACKDYYHKGFEDFVYTSPVSGVVTVNSADGRFKQIVYVVDGNIRFGDISLLCKVGRPKKINKSIVSSFKEKGYTQEKVAQELGVSLSTVRRNWN